MTIRQIVKRLNEGTWRPRSGRRWAPSVVHHILADPVYAGTAYANRYHCIPPRRPRTRGPRTVENSSYQLRPKEEWIPIPVPAIIDQATYHQAQEQLARNARLSFRHNIKHAYLLRCLLVCKTCGRAMYGVTDRAAAKHPARHYYRCAGKDCIASGRTERCPQHSAKGEELEAAVWDHVCTLLRDPDQLVAQFEHFAQLAAEGGAGERSEEHQHEARLRRLAREEARLIDAYQAEVIELEELRQRRQRVEERRLALITEHEQQRQLRQQSAHAHQVLADLAAFCRRIDARLDAATCEEKQAILQLLIERIIVGDDTIEIHHVIPLRSPAPASPAPAPANDRLRPDGVLVEILHSKGAGACGRPGAPRPRHRYGDRLPGES